MLLHLSQNSKKWWTRKPVHRETLRNRILTNGINNSFSIACRPLSKIILVFTWTNAGAWIIQMTLSQGETACVRLKFCDSWTGWIPWKKTTVPLLPVSPGRNRAQSSWAFKLGDGYNTADGYRKYLPLAWRGRHLGVGKCTRSSIIFFTTLHPGEIVCQQAWLRFRWWSCPLIVLDYYEFKFHLIIYPLLNMPNLLQVCKIFVIVSVQK